MSNVFIIAEAGINHNGDLDLAKEMIAVAAKCGADAVKFQTFIADKVVCVSAPKAEYQKLKTSDSESHLEMIRNLELDLSAHRELLAECKKNNIQFLSSPFDLESITLLQDLNVPIFKIPSGEITNLPYLKKIGELKKKIILSTGMSTMEEVECALNLLVTSGTKLDDISLLHCTSVYPASYDDVNLLAMLTMKEKLGVSVGYSDHTLGIEIPIAAVALGARIVEKHFTLNRNMLGPDHEASLIPDELKKMISAIRNVEKAFGSNEKKPTKSELGNIAIARKSIVAAKHILAGDVLSEDNITTKRPGNGISPLEWNSVLGKKAKHNFDKDTKITF